MIVDGRGIASAILAELRSERERTPIVRAVVVAPTPATESYLSIKAARAEEAGMRLDVVRLSDVAVTEDVVAAVERPGADSVIVQLPLPAHLDSETILDAIPLAKDADILSTAAYARFSEGLVDALLPPVVGAIAEIHDRADVAVRGMRACVVGQGRLVGTPAATWLRNQGVQVTVVTRESADLSALKDADIIVLGAGSPGLVKPEHVREGAVIIDAGTSEQGGAIVGDADPACASVASVFTPVPGGVGPVAVACLFRNASLLLGRALQQG